MDDPTDDDGDPLDRALQLGIRLGIGMLLLVLVSIAGYTVLVGGLAALGGSPL